MHTARTHTFTYTTHTTTPHPRPCPTFPTFNTYAHAACTGSWRGRTPHTPGVCTPRARTHAHVHGLVGYGSWFLDAFCHTFCRTRGFRILHGGLHLHFAGYGRFALPTRTAHDLPHALLLHTTARPPTYCPYIPPLPHCPSSPLHLPWQCKQTVFITACPCSFVAPPGPPAQELPALPPHTHLPMQTLVYTPPQHTFTCLPHLYPTALPRAPGRHYPCRWMDAWRIVPHGFCRTHTLRLCRLPISPPTLPTATTCHRVPTFYVPHAAPARQFHHPPPAACHHTTTFPTALPSSPTVTLPRLQTRIATHACRAAPVPLCQRSVPYKQHRTFAAFRRAGRYAHTACYFCHI